MKVNNSAVAAVLGMGVFVAASTNLQTFALDTSAGKSNTGIALSHYDALTVNTPIHEESVYVTFNHTGVVCCDGALDAIDKNAAPNF